MEQLEINNIDKTIEELQKKRDKAINANKPAWLIISPKGKLSVNKPLLAQTVLNENSFIIAENDSKDYLFIYLSKPGYWYQVNKDKIKSIVTPMLIKWNVWTAKNETDTAKLIYSSIKRINFKSTLGNTDPRYINFKNGVWDWQNMELIAHSPSFYFTKFIPIELYPNVKKECPETEKWLKLSLKENYLPMMEFIGYCFYPSYEPIQAFVILRSDGGDGKSTFGNYLVKNVFGVSNVSNVSLKDLSSAKDNNFKLSELIGKYLNFYDDISKDIIKDISVIKVLTGGGEISASKKNENDRQFSNYAKLLFACNTLPEFRNNEPAFKRRINVFEFYRIEDFKSTIDMNKVKEEIPAFIYKCMLLAKKAFKHPDHLLTQTPSAINARKAWLYENDIIAQFIENCCYIDTTATTNKDDLYQCYLNWCLLEKRTGIGKTKFFKALQDKGFILDTKRIRTIDRKRIYFIRGIKLNEQSEQLAIGNLNPVTKKY